jgi:hypothetical protein
MKKANACFFRIAFFLQKSYEYLLVWHALKTSPILWDMFFNSWEPREILKALRDNFRAPIIKPQKKKR